MLGHNTRLVITIILLALTVNQGVAQNLVTASLDNGARVDYPVNWYIETDEDDPDWIGFVSDSMSLSMMILPLLPVDDSETALVTWIEDIEDKATDVGTFSAIQTYTLNGDVEVWRARRVRSDDYLVEMLYSAIVNDFLVFLQANFKIGAQGFLLPIYDEMIASVRDSGNETVIFAGSRSRIPLIKGTISSESEPLYIGALNTNFLTGDGQYQFDYPDSWEIRSEIEGTITFIENISGTVTLFGKLIISHLDIDVSTTDLVRAQFDTLVEVSDFMLNDLPSSRLIITDEANNVEQLVMATTRGDIQAVLNVTIASDESEKTQSVLRAMLYSVRPGGEAFTLSVTGDAMRTGLLSAEVYGQAIVPIFEPIPDDIMLDKNYVTRNGRFIFNYPADWFEAYIEGFIVISNDDDIELFDPSRNDVQLLIDFLDLPDVSSDNSKAYTLLENYVNNDDLSAFWSRVRVLEGFERDIAYAEFSFVDDDQIDRVYLLRLDEEDTVYVRIDVIVDIEDIDGFEGTILAIIETIRFQD